MKKDPNILSKSLINYIGEDNIYSYTHCMTRFRVHVKDLNKIDLNQIKKIENVLGVVLNGNELQIILGPGFVRKVFEETQKNFPNLKFGELIEEDLDSSNSKDSEFVPLSSVAQSNKEAIKQKNNSSIQQFLAKFSNIFSPLIFGFIGVGILAGIGGILQSIYIDPLTGEITNEIASSWYSFFSVMLNLWKDAFIIVVGWRTAEVFGGEGVVGAIGATMFVSSFASLYTAPFISQGADGFQFLGISIKDPTTNWLTIGFRPDEIINDVGEVTGYTLSYASGAIFGAMMMAFISIPICKFIRKHTPDVIDMVLSSTLTFFVLLVLGYTLIIPISGIIFQMVAILFDNLSTNAFGAAFLAGIFLLAVVFGVHQGFVPVYAALLDSTGVNSLFAILAMGGAGQVGVAISLYFKADSTSILRKQIKGAIIPGFLGIGEPLIYGVTLPRPKTFVAAMLGASIGGLFLGALSSWGGITVGLNTMFGPSGLLAAPMMTAKINDVIGNVGKAIPLYLSALIISYISGYGFMQLIGTKGVDLS
ncbi:MAG: PTS system N-acetylmuramic acid-specific EIIBC component [Candidatus Tyloplasma litorale]|nr:MAG: PTS system N-acetylmuramic acid-specific EIIBC component [Mycoplasmatales bacterium]